MNFTNSFFQLAVVSLTTGSGAAGVLGVTGAALVEAVGLLVAVSGMAVPFSSGAGPITGGMLVTEVAFCSEPGSGAGWGFGPNMVCKTGAPISKSTEATKIIFPVRSIYESFCLFVGTGSCPQPPQGWQRPKRFNVSQDPRNAPCFVTASMAYCEQLGSNRQMIPPASPVSKGEMAQR